MILAATTSQVVIEENLQQFLLVLSVSLSVVALSQIFIWFRQIPYTLLLVIVGLFLALMDIQLVDLSPELILDIFLPPLLFEAAWNLEWRHLKRDLVPICLYAVFGVIVSVAGTALALQQLAGVSLTTALLLAASLSATDPVSVTALFRELGVDKRLTTLIEGESLFNDGVAVIAFSLLVELSLGNDELDISTILAHFFAFIGIGIGVGSLIGFGISYLTQRFNLSVLEQSLTLVSAYGTYLLTEDWGGSGVIGVVTTGLILGNFGSRIGMQPRTRLIVSEFWDFVAFLVNSIVFLLVGAQIDFASLGENLRPIAVAIGAMLLTRAIGIYGLGGLSNWLVNSQISLREQTVLWWGGLRGSVSIALALSIPAVLSDQETIIATVFGVVLFTLLAQGLTTKSMLEKLGLLGDQHLRQKYLQITARRVALKQVLNHLSQSDKLQEIEPEFYHRQADLVQGQLDRLHEEINHLQKQYPQLRALAIQTLREELLAIEANTYAEFVQAGLLSNQLSPLLQQYTDGNENII